MRRLAATLLITTLAVAGSALSPAVAAEPEPVAEPVAAELPTRAVVKDPAPDAWGSSPALRRLAEIRKVAYRTPTVEGGTMTIRVTWRRLRNPASYDGPRQRLLTFVDPRTSDDSDGYFVEVDRAAFGLYVFRDGSDDPRRVRPEQLDIEQVYGARGTTTITMSTEWLTADRVQVSTESNVGRRGFGYDFTNPRTLRVGPAPR